MIHNAIMNRVRDTLEDRLMTQIDITDDARVGIVKLGSLDGEPDPDIARISITIYENDPDTWHSGAFTGMDGKWVDAVDELEVGGVITMKRRFVVKGRCLLEGTQEGLADARRSASTVRTRLEHALLTVSFGDINENGEYVSRGIFSDAILGEMRQSGGPPDSYDFFIKVRFEVLTTK